LSFSASADPTDALFYYTLAFNIFLSPSVSAELADTLSDLTLFSLLSISGQIDWHAWSTFRAWRTFALEFQCVDFCVIRNIMLGDELAIFQTDRNTEAIRSQNNAPTDPQG